MTSEQARNIVDGATQNAVRDVRARRTTWIAFAVLLASIIVAALWFGPRLTALGDRSLAQDQQITDLTKRSDKNASDGQALRDQVVRLGGTPVVEPALPGTAGQPGTNGSNGTNGRDGTSPPCLLTAGQCEGAAGQDGAAGVNGLNGAAGADGRDGVDGQPGAAGKDGANGQDGAAGPPGPTCPPGYVQADSIETLPDGSTKPGKACIAEAGAPTPSTSSPLPIPLN